MKNIIKLLITSLLFVALFFTLFSYKEIGNFWSVFKGNLAFSHGKFIDAQSNYLGVNELGLSEDNQNVLDFNTANTFYGDKVFSGALRFYSRVKDLNPDITYLKFHNVGNSLYRLGQLEDENSRVNTWTKSLGAYDIALKSKTLKDKKDTVANYEFVKKELDKLKDKLKKKQEEEKKKQSEKDPKKENSSSGAQDKPKGQDKPKEEPQKPEDNKTSDNAQNSNQSQKSWAIKGTFNQLGQNGAENSEKLSPEEKQELQEYSTFLKKFQKGNLGNVQKGPSNPLNNNLNNIINNVLQDPNFTDVVPNVDKDW